MAIIRGNAADEFLQTFAPDDQIYGEGGNDTLDSGAGSDILDGGIGADLMIGGLGDDVYVSDSLGDVTTEQFNEGNDTLFCTGSSLMGSNIEIGRLVGAGINLSVAASQTFAVQLVVNPTLASTVLGGAGDDVLWGGGVGGTMFGRGGDDILRDQAAATTMHGGVGNDQFVINSLSSVIVENANEGIDTAWLEVDGYTLSDNIEITYLAGAAKTATGGNTAEQLVSNQATGSTLFGRGGDDVLWGSVFADSLDGGAGDDIMRGQGGADTMLGGDGNDSYVVLDPGVVIRESANQGYDFVYIGLAANIDFTLADNVEWAILSGAANRLTGNASDNYLLGGGLSCRIDGQGGSDQIFGSNFADTLIGGAGDDTIYCYGGADRLLYQSAGWGSDQLSGFATADGAKLDFRGSGLTFANLTLGVSGGNTLVSSGNDTVLVFGAVLTSNDFLF